MNNNRYEGVRHNCYFCVKKEVLYREIPGIAGSFMCLNCGALTMQKTVREFFDVIVTNAVKKSASEIISASVAECKKESFSGRCRQTLNEIKKIWRR